MSKATPCHIIFITISSLIHYFRQQTTLETLRPLPLFLGLTSAHKTPSNLFPFCFSPHAYHFPLNHFGSHSYAKLYSSFVTNLQFFHSNYIVIFCCTTLFVTILHPIMLLYLILLWFLWSTHRLLLKKDVPSLFSLRKHPFLNIFLDIKGRKYMLYTITLLILYFYCLIPCLCVACVTFGLIFGHALTRDAKGEIGRYILYRKKGGTEYYDCQLSEEVVVNEDISDKV